MIVSGSDSEKLHITMCPVYSNWYDNFMKVLEKFMGKDTKQDLALDMNVIVLVIDYVNTQ